MFLFVLSLLHNKLPLDANTETQSLVTLKFHVAYHVSMSRDFLVATLYNFDKKTKSG